MGRPSKNRPDRAAPGGNGARAAAPGYAGAGAAARIRRAVRAFAYDDLSAPACVLLSIAFILSGISHAAQSTLLDGHGAFPTAGDNLPMAALYVLLFGAAWAFPERAESLARSRSGRAAVCLSALAGAAGLVLAGPLAAAGSGWAAAAGHAGSLLTRVAGALLMLVCAGLTVYRGLSWSACLACTALLGAVACDLLVLLLSADGAAVLVLCLPVVAWVLLARVQRERRGDRIGRGAEHLHVQRVRGHSFALEVALFGMYGLAGGMSSGQSFTIAGTPGPSSPALPQSLVNDLGLVLGVAVVALGVAALLARRVSPMPLRAVALPSYTACLFLAPLSADGSGVFVPVLVSLTQSLLYALLWLVPHVTDTARPLRGFAASCCAFLGCSFVGMWVGGELLPSALPGDVFMAGAVVLVCAIFVVEVRPRCSGRSARGSARRPMPAAAIPHASEDPGPTLRAIRSARARRSARASPEARPMREARLPAWAQSSRRRARARCRQAQARSARRWPCCRASAPSTPPWPRRPGAGGSPRARAWSCPAWSAAATWRASPPSWWSARTPSTPTCATSTPRRTSTPRSS